MGPVVLAGTVMLRKDLYHGAGDETVRSFKCEMVWMIALDVWESQPIRHRHLFEFADQRPPAAQGARSSKQAAHAPHAACASRPLGHMSSL